VTSQWDLSSTHFGGLSSIRNLIKPKGSLIDPRVLSLINPRGDPRGSLVNPFWGSLINPESHKPKGSLIDPRVLSLINPRGDPRGISHQPTLGDLTYENQVRRPACFHIDFMKTRSVDPHVFILTRSLREGSELIATAGHFALPRNHHEEAACFDSQKNKFLFPLRDWP
jgi:hypothetical protein